MWLPGAETIWFSHDPCIAVQIVEWKIKDEVNCSWTETELEQSKLHELYCTYKNLIRDLKCWNFKLIGKSNNHGHLHCSYKNSGKSFSDFHSVKRRLHWLKNYFRQKFTSIPGLLLWKFVWDCFALLRDFVLLPLHWGDWAPVLPEEAFPMKSLRTGDIFCCCSIKGRARCRIQLPGRTCQSRSWT